MTTTEITCCIAHVTSESLIADKRRVPCSTFKSLTGPTGPSEEFALMNQRARFIRVDNSRGISVLLDSHAVGMRQEKPPITAGRVEHTVRLAANSPVDE